VIPDDVATLFWEVDAGAIDLVAHRDYVLERVMARGDLAAMRWLAATFSKGDIADFVRRKGSRLCPRDRAFWALIGGVEETAAPGGGRPGWAG